MEQGENTQEVEVFLLRFPFMRQDPFADASAEQPVSTEDPFAAPAPSGSSPVAPADDDFKFTREWNMKFRERCEEKDKEALEKKQETLKEAREEVQSWEDERKKKIAKKTEMLREEEAKLMESMGEDSKSANPWERVNKLVDMNSDEHDLARMKQVMIRMKNDAAKNQCDIANWLLRVALCLLLTFLLAVHFNGMSYLGGEDQIASKRQKKRSMQLLKVRS